MPLKLGKSLPNTFKNYCCNLWYVDDLNRSVLTYNRFGGSLPKCYCYQLFLSLKACVLTYISEHLL